jgi:hypothetical protein
MDFPRLLARLDALIPKPHAAQYGSELRIAAQRLQARIEEYVNHKTCVFFERLC